MKSQYYLWSRKNNLALRFISIKMPKYTVHNFPFLLKPFLHLYGWIGGIGLILLNIFHRRLIRIEYVDNEHVNSTPNFIFALWHENVPLYFIAHQKFKRPHCWLSFPFWFMKPTHILKRLIGIQEIAYGASGHNGKKALHQVVNRLQEGWSTFINPDGPKGPVKVMKDGVLIMSLKTGTPIIPVSFQVEGNWRIRSWDKKRYPPFFKTLKVVYGAPILVTTENFEWARKQVAASMNDVPYPVTGHLEMPYI